MCKQRVQIPASIKKPFSHELTHLLFCNSKLFEHVKQSFSVGPRQVSQVEWHEWHRPFSEYSAKGCWFFQNERKEENILNDGQQGNQRHMWNCNNTFMAQSSFYQRSFLNVSGSFYRYFDKCSKIVFDTHGASRSLFQYLIAVVNRAQMLLFLSDLQQEELKIYAQSWRLSKI